MMREGMVIRMTAPAEAGWFEVHSAFSGSAGTWILPEGTKLRYVGLMNSPPIGSDPMPVDHFEVLTGEHTGRFVDQIGEWEIELERLMPPLRCVWRNTLFPVDLPYGIHEYIPHWLT